MNSIKMTHTVARYHNTDERMTGLFVKITNQMIINCKKYILGFKGSAAISKKSSKGAEALDGSILWEQDMILHDELIVVLKQCLVLLLVQIEKNEKILPTSKMTAQEKEASARIKTIYLFHGVPRYWGFGFKQHFC